jgi:hypothetical protein
VSLVEQQMKDQITFAASAAFACALYADSRPVSASDAMMSMRCSIACVGLQMQACHQGTQRYTHAEQCMVTN